MYQFTDEDRSAGGQRSAVVQRSRWMERHRQNVELSAMLDDMAREDVGTMALLTVLRTAQALADSPVPKPEDATDYKRLVESIVLAHKVMRLEAGESTSNSATLDVTDRDARVQELKARLAELGDTPTS